MPTLTGQGSQKSHDFCYWEFHEQGSKQAVRTGDWKAVRLRPSGPIELYDLKTDLGETKNIAGDHPDIVQRMTRIMRSDRTESKEFPLREIRATR